jgi:valyl-tRNA synthetase
MSLSTRYSPQDTEQKWYRHWMEKGYFHSQPDERAPYTIVIPPPNVTGHLHMGHMLNNTIQDILIRKARLDGKNACWVPGTDHASIATEAKVVQMLRARGIKKSDLSREEFLAYAWEWKEKYGGVILDQLRRLGASCDWRRTRFTMEEKMSRAVIHVFVDLYRKGKIYRGLRMTNWDPEARTALSNEEVIYSEENSQLFHLRYPVADDDGDQALIIATQRPETIMADTAAAVHPDDERFRHLIGRQVRIPLIDKAIPVIADPYVDREFGTGALKITPAHDQNDYDIGLRHQLEVVDILNEDGTLNEKAVILVGDDRFTARKKIIKMLEDGGFLVKTEEYRTKIGRSERTNAVVEPRLTLQWFLDMKDFAAVALRAVENGEVRFYPEHFWNMFYSWLREDNIRDWCISRQLWWGQRIPAWYWRGEEAGKEKHIFVAETAEEAMAIARQETGDPALSLDELRQDEDVVDTWFSSWLWPLSVFDGFESPEELRYYYPTDVLVTGWDIMFFWVARMIMAGYEWSEALMGSEWVERKGRQPFRDVYFTGMVRDNKRRKMSKSLGNSPDALRLIDNYGADGVRFGMLTSAAAGNDIIFDASFDPTTGRVRDESKLCEQGRNFCNKMWNALRLVKGWSLSEQAGEGPAAEINRLAGEWMTHKFHQAMSQVDAQFREYRLSETLMTLYKLIWDDFCSWYLEMIKPSYGQSIDRTTLEITISLFERMMIALHPFMPFVTEEIWHQLRTRGPGEDCIVARYPAAQEWDAAQIERVEKAKTLVSAIRETRNNQGVKNKELSRVYVQAGNGAKELFEAAGLKSMVMKMANLEMLAFAETEPANSVSFLAGSDKYFLEVDRQIDVEEECRRLRKELEYHQGFVRSVERKLNNDKFVGNAPPEVVERERQKAADGKAKIKNLEEALWKLGCTEA